MLGSDLKFVSRGGLKLERALDHWAIDLTALACLDVGASTGGFTDCMLQRGAASVLAIDTGYGQIAQSLRSDPRVTLRERTNARLPPTPRTSPPPARRSAFSPWTSRSSPPLSSSPPSSALSPSPTAPGREPPSSSSNPSSKLAASTSAKAASSATPAGRQLAIDRVTASALSLNATALDLIDSPIKGMEGNHEYLLRCVFTSDPLH